MRYESLVAVVSELVLDTEYSAFLPIRIVLQVDTVLYEDRLTAEGNVWWRQNFERA